MKRLSVHRALEILNGLEILEIRLQSKSWRREKCSTLKTALNAWSEKSVSTG